MIEPISSEQRSRVTQQVERYIHRSRNLYQQNFASIPVRFDIKGRVAGMYKVKRNVRTIERAIRFNPWLFAKYPEDSWENTVPHEVAHYIADCRFGLHSIKPHGSEWQSIMQDFGAEPKATAHYDLADIPTRRMQRYSYRCGCQQVELSSIRHQKIVRGQQRYLCKKCHQELEACFHHG